MAIQTLKIGEMATIKATGQSDVIIDVRSGLYEIKGIHPKFYAGELVAVKIKPAQKKKEKINRVSEQRKKLNAIYSIIAKEIKATPAICEGWGKLEGCTRKATQIHHKGGRRGFLLIMSKFFGRQCAHCHRFVTTHSETAVEIGLSVPINSSSKPCFTKKEVELMEKYNVILPKLHEMC